MEKVYEELDEAKIAIERLKEDCRRKAELYDSLRGAYNEQVTKFQEARVRFEKQTRELGKRADEASEAKRVCEDLKFSLSEKESIIRRLTAANEKIRVDCDDKTRMWDEEKRGLVVALDEVNEKAGHQEQTICVLRGEIKDLKGVLSASRKKVMELEESATVTVEMRNKDDLFSNLEEEHRKVADRLKWKNEQFTHLEEAHGKLKEEFKENKINWEVEKSSLLGEICSLQTRLDSQTRISEDLRTKLQVCNQALAHEESRRKFLEIQVSEFQTRYEIVVAECDDAKTKIECFNCQRDSEVASLRNSLSEKEALHKEMEYRVGRLELENQELLMSVKELQEAGINSAGNSTSTVKLRNKLKSMEQAYKNCTTTLKVKEAEWCSRLEEMTSQLDICKSESEEKDEKLKKLRFELEDCQSTMMQLRLQYDDALKSKISDAKLEIIKNSECNKEREEEISNLMKQLEMKNSALAKAEAAFREEHEKTKTLLRKVETLGHVEEQRSKVQEDVERYRRLLEESSKCRFNLEHKLLQLEVKSEEKLTKLFDALDKAESEVADKYSEGIEVQYEMWIWKSIAEQLKTDLEDSLQIHKELEASLHARLQDNEAITEEKDNLVQLLEDKSKRMHNLELQVVWLEKELEVKQAEAISNKHNAVMALESQELKHLQILKYKDNTLKDLQNEIEGLELECLVREFEGATIAQLAAESVFEFEKAHLVQLVKEKENQIANLSQLLGSVELKLVNSLQSSSLEVLKKQAEIDLAHEARENIVAAHFLSCLEIEEKNMMVIELENDIRHTQKRLDLQEKMLSESKLKNKETEAKMKAELLQVNVLASQMEYKLNYLGCSIDNLERENRNLLEGITKLSSENEMLVSFIAEMDSKISRFSDEEMQLMKSYERIFQSLDKGGPRLQSIDESTGSVKEKVKTILRMQKS